VFHWNCLLSLLYLVATVEIFDIKNSVTLKLRLGHPSSSKMAPTIDYHDLLLVFHCNYVSFSVFEIIAEIPYKRVVNSQLRIAIRFTDHFYGSRTRESYCNVVKKP